MEVGILGTGHYLPARVVTNHDFAQIVDTSDEWIRTRTGIAERHLTSGEENWYMGLKAAEQALAAAGSDPLDIDLVLVTTITPDYSTPNTASILQGQLGLKNAFCFDLNAACTGFVYAIDLAAHYLLNPEIKQILIVSTEMLSSITDYTRRSTCILFGDGAGAVVVGRNGGRLLASHLGTVGEQAGAIVRRAEQIDHPFLEPEVAARWQPLFPEATAHVDMDGQAVFRFAVSTMEESIRKVSEKSGVDISEITVVVPHQANQRILEAAGKRLGIPVENIFSDICHTGNTSSASIPIGLDQLTREGQLKKGDKVILCGFGGGLTYGAVMLEI